MLARESTKRHETKTVDDLYQLADALLCADRIIERLWKELPKATEDALDAELGTFDFLMASKGVRAVADAWQGRIDQEQA